MTGYGRIVQYTTVLIDEPAPRVRRITLNRPEKRNALNEALRAEILLSLQEADRDPGVHVMILRGAGKCFSAGYDLSGRGGETATGSPLPRCRCTPIGRGGRPQGSGVESPALSRARHPLGGGTGEDGY